MGNGYVPKSDFSFSRGQGRMPFFSGAKREIEVKKAKCEYFLVEQYRTKMQNENCTFRKEWKAFTV